MTVVKLSLQLMLYVLIGVYVQKRKIVNDDFEKQLSSLLMEVVLPPMIIRSMQMDVTAEDLRTFGLSLVFCVGWILFSVLVGQIFWRLLGKGPSGRVYRYSTIFTNYTIIGLPVISAIYDQQTVFYFSIFVIPVRIALYIISGPIMTPPEKGCSALGKPSWRMFCSPPLIAVVIGLTLCLLGWRIPETLDIVMASMSGMSLPLGMILCGLIVGKFPLRRVFSKKAFGIMLIRNLMLPGIMFLCCRLLGLPPIAVRSAVIFAALPVGPLLVSFATKYDDCEQTRYESAGAIIATTLFSSITVPLWVGLLGM